MQYFVESCNSSELVGMYCNLEYNPLFDKIQRSMFTGLIIAVGFDVNQIKTAVESLLILRIDCYTELLDRSAVTFKYTVPYLNDKKIVVFRGCSKL